MDVIRYHRVSTEHQSLKSQNDMTDSYVNETFDAATTTVEVDADTGIDTDREGYQRMIERVESSDVDVVVTRDISRVARSMRDLMLTIDKFKENGVELHFVEDPVTVEPNSDDPTQNLILQVLGAVAEFEAKITQQRVREGIAARQESDEYHHGPAPLGFRKEDGMLIETEQFDQICAVLDMVKAGELSQRKAAQRLDTSRKTVRNCINERPELYGLGTGNGVGSE